MLYRFKSRATADVILLEPAARQILQAIGKPAGPTGIVTVAEMPAAIAALEAAAATDDGAAAKPADDAADASDEGASRAEPVQLRQRVVPFIDMLKRSAAEGKDVVWGV